MASEKKSPRQFDKATARRANGSGRKKIHVVEPASARELLESMNVTADDIQVARRAIADLVEADPFIEIWDSWHGE